jgi:hypothetical protein
MRFTFMILAAALFMAACGSKADGPKEVATKFLTHINAMEFEEAKQYGTKETNDLLDMLKSFAAMGGEEQKPEATAFTITDVKEEGETATVTYKSEGSEEAETLNLVKQEGKWLVNISKEDMNKDEDMGGAMEDMDGAMEEGLDDMGAAVDSLGNAIEEGAEQLQETLENAAN